jgi:bile acid:Na+ symporter, BASS family
MSPLVRDFALVAIVLLMFVAGLNAVPGQIVAALRQTNLLARALIVNVVIVPLLAVAIVRGFSLSQSTAIGVMLMALAPGVPFLAVSAGAKRGGSEPFAVTLSFLLPAVSVVTLPLWVGILAPAIVGLHMPVIRSVVTILLVQLLPLLAGIAIGRRSERLRTALLPPAQLASTLALLAVVVLIAVPAAKALGTLFGTRALAAILSLSILGLGLGWSLGGPMPETRRTLAIATVLRNVGLAAALGATFFPDTGVLVAVVAFLVIQLLVSTSAGALFSRRRAGVVPPGATPPAATPAH